MASNYPTSLDSFTDPTSGSSLASPSHSGQHIDLNDAVEKLETKLGIGSAAASSASVGTVLTITSSATSTWSVPSIARFTNEAARDAAITSPVEGMVVFLTAPTAPAATGGATYVPTGIISAYNGTSWVCLTPVSAQTVTSGTIDVNPYAALSGGGTAPTVSLTTGTSALVHVHATFTPSVSSTQMFYIGVNVTGATTLAVSDYSAVGRPSSQTFTQYIDGTFLIAGLTAGTNTFGLQYGRTNVGGAVTVSSRSITAVGLL